MHFQILDSFPTFSERQIKDTDLKLKTFYKKTPYTDDSRISEY